MTISITPFPKAISFTLQYIYPLIGTLKLTHSLNRQDASTPELTNMLFYWIVCGFVFISEGIFGLITKIPFYYDLKIVALLWLTLPVFSGSGYIYYMYIHDSIGGNFESNISKITNRLQVLKSSLSELSNHQINKKPLSHKNRKSSKR